MHEIRKKRGRPRKPKPHIRQAIIQNLEKNLEEPLNTPSLDVQNSSSLFDVFSLSEPKNGKESSQKPENQTKPLYKRQTQTTPGKKPDKTHNPFVTPLETKNLFDVFSLSESKNTKESSRKPENQTKPLYKRQTQTTPGKKPDKTHNPFVTTLETKSLDGGTPQILLFDVAPWSSSMRALPNDYARSALFTVRNKRVAREARQSFPIFHVNEDVSITYTGLELRAEDDELVWQQVLHYARRVPVGEPVSFTFYRLCCDLGWSINGQYYTRAEECLTRLQASAMQFSSRRLGRLESVSLLRRFRVLSRGSKQSRCQVEIDSEMVLLFGEGNYTRFVWEAYRKLSPTARRLFDYCGSHKKPFPLAIQTFRLLCGADTRSLKKWRQQVRKACSELETSGLVRKVFLEKDKVHCLR